MPVEQVLWECLRHFVHLDHSNAAIHCAGVRYSPITFRLAEALVDIAPDFRGDPDLEAVLAHVGIYEEDQGR